MKRLMALMLLVPGVATADDVDQLRADELAALHHWARYVSVRVTHVSGSQMTLTVAHPTYSTPDRPLRVAIPEGSVLRCMLGQRAVSRIAAACDRIDFPDDRSQPIRGSVRDGHGEGLPFGPDGNPPIGGRATVILH